MFGTKKDINALVEEAKALDDAVIIDVRGKDEFAAGHIEGAVNIPLADLPFSMGKLGDLDTPLYVYCLAGPRAKQAVSNLKRFGFEQVVNMGGIRSWNGEIVK